MLSATVRSTSGVLAALLLLPAAACGSRARHARDVPNSPQAVLEAQLINRGHRPNKRTRDGGMLHTAALLSTRHGSLRGP